MDEELYKENILELYRNPHNKREMAGASFSGRGVNASCGDKIDLYLDVFGGKIQDASFMGDGCAISQASVSLLTDFLKGKTMDEAKALSPGDIYNMLHIKISPGRINCALLGYEALQKTLKK